MVKSSDLVVWLHDIDKEDVAFVGGKSANLGEMIKAGFPVPGGFALTTTAYYNFLSENDLKTKIRHLLGAVDYNNSESVEKASSHIKKFILAGKIPEATIKKVFSCYMLMKQPFVAVRSSATSEDSKTASFAGQQETFLNVKGEANLFESIKKGWASLFEPRAIFYRHENKFDHFRVGISLVVQKMIESEVSGIMFTIDPVTSDKSKIVIEAIYGLGEYIVQGKVTPDHYEVDKNNFSILEKKVEKQDILLKKVASGNKEARLEKNLVDKIKLSNEEIVHLAKLAKQIEKHYYFPQDIEWAKENKKLYIVQTRPITTILKNQETKIKKEQKSATSNTQKPVLSGSPASPGIATGIVKILKSPKEVGKIKKGEILVAEYTNPDYVPAMKKAAAIITEKGGRTSHAAIVSREFGIPAVVGAQNAMSILKDGIMITVNGRTGEIYKGSILVADKNQKIISSSYKTKTKLYVNLAEPEKAKEVATKNVDGIGLLRAEFMIAGIGVHPKKLIKEHKEKIFIRKLADGLVQIARAFYPRFVLYRATDFKTNEYRGLLGGKDFEPIESNPMLGYRGAYRYINDARVFELELEAIKYVREKKGLDNLNLMIPFVRTPSELAQVKKIISSCQIKRDHKFKLYMMVEIPSNVILLEEFIKIGIDGVSIGSNDLTMLILGTDRDNSEVASVFDERNPAVLWALEKVIKTCKRLGVASSICGQAPSVYPDLVEKLVEWGITSISVSEDAIDITRDFIHRVENSKK